MGRLIVGCRWTSLCAVAAWTLVGCGGGLSMGGGDTGGSGVTGAAGRAGQSGASGGSTGTGGVATTGAGGSTTGAGGSTTTGKGGATTGTGGFATTGAGGVATTGTGGATMAGTGGAMAGTGGATTGTGGASGAGGLKGTGGAGGAGATPTSAEALCTLFCNRLSTCDNARDQQTCLYSCRDSNSALFPNLRTDLIAGITACIASDDCATLDQSTSLSGCMSQADAALAPSAAGAAFCSALGTADTQCGITLNQTDCLNSIKLYSDAIVAQAMTCASKSCSLIYSCVSATLGQATGSWALGGGIKPGQQCSGTSYPCGDFYDQSSCQAAGCSFSGSCTGTPYCAYEYSSSSCGTLAGCTWSSSNSTCGGTPSVTCAGLGTSSTSCGQYTGCYYNQQCTGTTAACSTLTVTTCAAHAGCTIVDAS